jgi:transposase
MACFLNESSSRRDQDEQSKLTGDKYLSKFVVTFKNWREEILNYFIERITNGFVERLNYGLRTVSRVEMLMIGF